MKNLTIPISCSLTADEYKKFKAICDQNNTYPSAAIREAVMEWMERMNSDGTD